MLLMNLKKKRQKMLKKKKKTIKKAKKQNKSKANIRKNIALKLFWCCVFLFYMIITV